MQSAWKVFLLILFAILAAITTYITIPIIFGLLWGLLIIQDRIPTIINDTNSNVEMEITFHRWTEISKLLPVSIAPGTEYDPERYKAYCYSMNMNGEARELDAGSDVQKGWRLNPSSRFLIYRTIKISEMWSAAEGDTCKVQF